MSALAEAIIERCQCGDEDVEVILFPDLEEALIGTMRRFSPEGHIEVPIYDYEKCVTIMMEALDCSAEEAEEYLEYNTLGAYLGTGTPAFLFRVAPEDLVGFSPSEAN